MSDEFFILSPPKSSQNPSQKQQPKPKKRGLPWGFILGISSAIFAPIAWNYTKTLMDNPFVKNWDKCRQVSLSGSPYKSVPVVDWLTGNTMVKLPHGSRIIMADSGRSKDNQHGVILISDYQIPRHRRMEDYGVVRTGYELEDGEIKAFFIPCR